MNAGQHKIEPTRQKQHNSLHHNAINNVEEGNQIPARPETNKSRLFDRLNTVLGNYREVFDAWNPAESKIFTYLKSAYNRLIHLRKVNKHEHLLLKLIPIYPEQEGKFIDIRHLEEDRDGPI